MVSGFFFKVGAEVEAEVSAFAEKAMADTAG